MIVANKISLNKKIRKSNVISANQCTCSNCNCNCKLLSENNLLNLKKMFGKKMA